MNKKQIISHAVAFILGILGGFLGKDLSPLQKPVEVVVGQAADAVEHAAADAAKHPPAAAPAQSSVDAGPPPASLADPVDASNP